MPTRWAGGPFGLALAKAAASSAWRCSSISRSMRLSRAWVGRPVVQEPHPRQAAGHLLLSNKRLAAQVLCLASSGPAFGPGAVSSGAGVWEVSAEAMATTGSDEGAAERDGGAAVSAGCGACSGGTGARLTGGLLGGSRKAILLSG